MLLEILSVLTPLVVLVKKEGTISGLRSANLQSVGYGGWRPRFSSFAGRRRQVRGRWGAGCLKSLAPEVPQESNMSPRRF